jgi:glutaconate CoA-transferase subunit A
MFTRAASGGALHIIEETEASLAFGIRAQMAGVGFMPSRAWIGTDLLKLRPDVKTITDPYSGETLVAFPAIPCDVAVIHALAADRRGNARLNKNLGIDPELATIAPQVVVTAEEVVDTLTEDVQIPGALVTAVVHAPRGAWPTSCYPYYPIGGGELLNYVEMCASGQFEDYLATVNPARRLGSGSAIAIVPLPARSRPGPGAVQLFPADGLAQASTPGIASPCTR